MKGIWGLPGLVLGALLFVACDNGAPPPTEPISPQDIVDEEPTPANPNQRPTNTVTRSDAGVVVDAGTKAPDAGVRRDAGTTVADAGVDAGTPVVEKDAGTPVVDAGVPDAGRPLEPIVFPTADGWKFYGPQDGLPEHVLGVSADEGGNLWVAGGRDGLYVLRSGSTTFERFGMEHGLHPFGNMADGGEPPGEKYLDVISVTGGPPGVVFVGYRGKPAPAGQIPCENNFDTAARDPSIYKSGDADKVTLTSTGIQVVNYDIWTGPGMDSHYPEGREKLCDIFEILWDKSAGVVWFGGNHGFAMGWANYTGNNSCNGAYSCSGLREHVHPLVEGYTNEQKTTAVTLSGAYRGMALYSNHDVFVGADIRSTRFKWGSNGGMSNPDRGYWLSQPQSENDASNWFDIWADLSQSPTPAQRKDDLVFGVATTGDGTFWVGSAAHGLARVSESGAVLATLKSELVAPHVSGVAADPSDGSIWAGARWGGGISRVKSGQVIQYGLQTFGPNLVNLPVSDVQTMGTGTGRKILVGFDGDGGKPGAVGIYSGT